MATREVKTYEHKCDFCDTRILTNNKESPFPHTLWHVWYGGYGDMERSSERYDCCTPCFEKNKEKYKQESRCNKCNTWFPYYENEKETGLVSVHLKAKHDLLYQVCQKCLNNMKEGQDYYFPRKYA